jgi:hypothetical protein
MVESLIPDTVVRVSGRVLFHLLSHPVVPVASGGVFQCKQVFGGGFIFGCGGLSGESVSHPVQDSLSVADVEIVLL